MTSAPNADLLNDMVHLFRGIRFRYMDPFNVDRVWLWIDACAETLETLRLDPTGEQPSLGGLQVSANRLAAGSALLSFDPSRHKSLRTLKFPAPCAPVAARDEPPDIASSLLKHVISTIAPPTPLEVVVVYRDYDIGVEAPQYPTQPPVRSMSPADTGDETLWHGRQFEVFREIHEVRGFRLVLCVNVRDCVGEYLIRRLKAASDL